MTLLSDLDKIRKGIPRVNTVGSPNITVGSLAPIPTGISGSRMGMFTIMLSQTPPILGASPPMYWTGDEINYGEWLDPIKLEYDTQIVAVINRHKNLSRNSKSPGKWVACIQDVENAYGEIVPTFNVIYMPRFKTRSSVFGCEYNYLLNLRSRDRLKADTIVAQSPSIDTNTGMWCYGMQVGSTSFSDPRLAEDGVWASDLLCEMGTTTSLVVYQFSFGRKRFPLNLHGDDDEYKIIPDIGEEIGGDGLLVATRKHDDLLAPVMMSKKACRKLDPSDQVVIVDRPRYGSSKIVDIKVYRVPKDNTGRGKGIRTPKQMCEQMNRYLDSDIASYNEILKVYESQLKNRISGLEVDKTFALGVYRDARYFVDDIDDPKITLNIGGAPVDEYSVFVTVEQKITLGIGSKVTGRHGNKGVIVDKSPVEDMPVNEAGDVAHFCEFTLAPISRMNPSLPMEIGYCACAMALTKELKKRYEDGDIAGIHRRIHRFYEITQPSILDTVGSYSEDGTFVVRDALIDEVLFGGRDVLLPSGKTVRVGGGITICTPHIIGDSPPEHIEALQKLYEEFTPNLTPITYRDTYGKMVTTNAPILIGGQYVMALERHAKQMTAVDTSRLNHFGTPSDPPYSARNSYPLKRKPTRFGNDEVDLLAAVMGDEDTMELLDRSNNVSARREMELNKLSKSYDALKDYNLDRELFPVGDTRVLKMLNNLEFCAGREVIWDE